MAKFENIEVVSQPSVDISAVELNINGKSEPPTREEFYTNYPFFKYWNTDNNQKLLSPEGINIYIHIPFCIQICDYCFYMKELIKSKDQVEEYVDYLCNEIKLVSEKFGLVRRKVNSIYIGGGTPSVLTEAQFKRLMATLHQYHSIETVEFAVEAEPGTFNRNKLEWYKACGVNRISMGVQSFDDKVIKLSSRKHTSAQAINAIKMAQDVGAFQLNIDILSGLAGETMDTWEQSVETALRQQIDMLTIYKMKTYANTNFFWKGVHTKEIELPNESEEITFMERALKMVLEADYGLWSTFAFTRNGSQSKYAENTWRGQDLIAYGASSFGKIGNMNYQNVNNTQLYYEKIKNGTMPVYRTYSLSFKDMIVKELLLCSRLASYTKGEFVNKFGFDYFDVIPEVMEELTLKGFISKNAEDLVLTRQGVLFGDFVAKTIASGVKNALSKDKIGFTY